ncbi:hypothetical protein [Aliikangiella sp. IMCC44632]
MLADSWSFLDPLQPWIAYLGLIFTFVRLYRWSKNKKTGAFIIGMLLQMVLPDPKVEQTIEIVQEQKECKKQQTNDDLKLKQKK